MNVRRHILIEEVNDGIGISQRPDLEHLCGHNAFAHPLKLDKLLQ